MGKLTPAEIEALEARRAQYFMESAISNALVRSMEHIKDLLSKHKLPAPVLVDSQIWLATGTWTIANLEADQNRLSLSLHLVWITSPLQRSTVPSSREHPEFFGPGFEIPHELQTGNYELNPSSTNYYYGSETEYGSGIPKQYAEAFKKELLDRLLKLDSIVQL
ncbi:MAG: hypothetical protein KW793_03390 [Candidatus Doudnabacteria bacterium]|nr:hypothetical protein [Candidatus Doudnabacteria bacterium]